jgi:hypothetical protein
MNLLEERAVGYNPWAEAFVLCPAGATELSPGFQPWEFSTKSDAPSQGVTS